MAKPVIPTLRDRNLEAGDIRRFQELDAPTSRWESIQTSFLRSQMDTATYGTFAERSYRSNLPNDPQFDLSPEELNKLYPDTDMPFNKPMNSFLTEIINERAKDKKELNLILNNAPQDFYQTILNMGGTAAAHMTDPIQASLYAATGIAATMAGAAAGVGVLGTLGLNAVANLASDIPLEAVYGNQALDDLEDYTIEDAGMNIAASVVLGSILETGAGYVGS